MGPEVLSGYPHTYATHDSPVFLGYENDTEGQQSTTFLDGYLDEVHIASTNRSLSWIQTEYNNQLNASLFAIVGNEQTAISTTVASSVNPSVYGQAVAFTATLTWLAGNPIGTVQFQTNGVNFGSPVTVVNGSATSPAVATLGVGTVTITTTFTDGVTPGLSTGTLTNGQVITPAPLTITANNTNKTYGTTATFLGTAFTPSGLQNGDTIGSVTLTSSGAPASATVGAYSIVPSAATGGTFQAANYTITYATTGILTVNPGPLTVTANNVVKTYGQTLTFAGTEFTTSGLANSDTVTSVTLVSGGTPALAAAGNYAITPSNAIGSGLTNYTISYATTGTLTVSPKALTVTAVADTKTYDGTTSSSKTPTVSGLVNGDLPNFTQAFDTKNVGSGKTLIPAGSANDGNGGNNYSVTFVNNTNGSITASGLTVTGITAANKVYDGTTTATLNVSGAALSGVMSGDILALNTAGAAGAFADKTAGNGKVVTISGLTISGRDAPNYTLTQPTTTANITAVALTVTGITANNKAYDGTTNATLNLANAVLVGVLSGDTVSLVTTNATGAFASDAVGNGITVLVSGLTLAGADAGNYTITPPTTTANITAIALTVTGITANNKVYDGTTSASLNPAGALLQGVLSGDLVTLVVTNATGAFTSAAAGVGKTVQVSGLTLTGARRRQLHAHAAHHHGQYHAGRPDRDGHYRQQQGL